MPDPLSVAMIAWPKSPERIAYFTRSVQSIHANLRWNGREIPIIVSAESQDVSSAEIVNFNRLCDGLGVRLIWREGRAHVGANMNHALRHARDSDFVLLTQDDWVLMDWLDMEPHCAFLRGNENFALIRLAYSLHPDHTIRGPQFEWYGLKLITIDGRSNYLYGDQPHLRRQDSVAKLGPYAEDGGIGNPEVVFNGMLQQSKWLIAASINQAFEHCGTITTTPER